MLNFLRKKIVEPLFWIGFVYPIAIAIGIIMLLWDHEDDDDFDLEPPPSSRSSKPAE